MPREFALPGTESRYAPDRAFDILHLRIEVDLDVEERSIAGTCSLTLSPIGAAVRWVRLDAVEMEIHSVRVGDEPLAFTHDGSVLSVDLGAELAENTSVVVAITYAAAPRRGLYFVGPDEAYPDKPLQAWTQGQDEDSRFWFPCLDSPIEKATSEVIATVPADWFALSNGTLVDDEVRGQRRRLHWKLDTPHSSYLVTLAAGKFTAIETRWNDVAVIYYVTPGDEEKATRTLGRTPEMLELFSRLFGVTYPYEKYAQIFVADFIFGGMENTTATTLTDIVLLDERATVDYDVENLVAHELAHQWFGDLLTCRDWGQGWLNEGFATYSEYLWREHAEGRDAADVELDEWADAYFAEDSSRYRRQIATNVYDEPLDIFDRHLYDKGGRVLHMLRRTLGDDGFWRAIRHYLEKHRHGVVETRDLARAVEEATGRVLDWFFDQWVLIGAGHPELTIEYAWDGETKLASLAVEQTQDTSGITPVFRLPTSIRFEVDGAAIERELEIKAKKQTFYFRLVQEPTHAIFDPGKPHLATVKMTKPTKMWIAELESAGLAIDRIAAARALARKGGPQALAALREALAEQPFWAVQAAAATGLGTLRTPEARDALAGAVTTTAHPRARRAVVRALGEFRRDETAADAVARLVADGDESYFVEAEACLSLGKTRSKRAPELLRAAAERDSFFDIIRQHAYRGLAEARDESAVPLLTAATAYGKTSQGRRAALGALAQLGAGRTDRTARDIREHAETLLRDPDFRVQGAAVEALGALRTELAIPALQALADRDLDGRLKRRCRELMRDLREGAGREKELTLLRDELDVLRAQTLALRGRLDAMEARTSQREKPRSPKAKPKSDGRKTKAKKTKKVKDRANAKAKKASKPKPRR